MLRPADPSNFIYEFLASALEGWLLSGLISPDQYHDRISALKDKSLRKISRQLFDESPNAIDFPAYGPLRIVPLREADRSEFPFLQGLARKSADARAPLKCFVGHRFLKDIEWALRFNLRHLLEPYGVSLHWSGYDLSSRHIFRGIVDGIKEADLCVFDNLGTLNKPNVYIEVGIAHALGKPMLVCEYVGRKRRVFDTGSVPSDLHGLFRIQYRSYEDLCRQLYFGLPTFLHSNGLR